MTVEQIEQIVHLKPFKPYRLVLNNGEEVIVDRPRKSHVSGDAVSLVGLVRKIGGNAAAEKFRIITVDKVVTAEHVNVPIRGK